MLPDSAVYLNQGCFFFFRHKSAEAFEQTAKPFPN